MLAVLDSGLAPFLFWWHKFPAVPLNRACVGLLFVSSLFLLIQISFVLQRLSAMLPDENLRAETKLFTGFNTSLLLAFLAGITFYFVLTLLPPSLLPVWLDRWMAAAAAAGVWLALFLMLMPLAMTMALLWKIKEVIFSSLTDAEQ
jgi:hypothetical protein